MLKEYALQPSLLADWQTCRLLLDKFGYGRGRVIARYPKAWMRMVYESAGTASPLDKKRIEEVLIRFKKALYPRHHEWLPNMSWLENAIDEHTKRPFAAIVTGNDESDHAAIIKEAALDEDNEPRWKPERQRRVARTATDMAACADLLLRNAKDILFVDPHFNPQAARFRLPLKAFLAFVANRQPSIPVDRIEIHCGHASAGVKSFFDNECRRHLPGVIPTGLSVRLVRWNQGHLHNRFVLTENGGLKFGVGLDEQDGGDVAYDQVDLLEPETHTSTWSEYQRLSPVFPLIEDDLVINGNA